MLSVIKTKTNVVVLINIYIMYIYFKQASKTYSLVVLTI